MSIVPIRGLFEAHLTVSDLDRSIAFYRDVLGLPLAQRIAARRVAFFWLPSPDKAMLGLWSIGTVPLRLRLHIAFKVELAQVFESVAALRREWWWLRRHPGGNCGDLCPDRRRCGPHDQGEGNCQQRRR